MATDIESDHQHYRWQGRIRSRQWLLTSNQIINIIAGKVRFALVNGYRHGIGQFLPIYYRYSTTASHLVVWGSATILISLDQQITASMTILLL